jgi:Fe-S cluster biosynthesis and repair protein YggX
MVIRLVAKNGQGEIQRKVSQLPMGINDERLKDLELKKRRVLTHYCKRYFSKIVLRYN